MKEKWEAKKMAFAKKMIEKKNMNEEQAAKFMEHIKNMTFGPRRNKKNGGKGRKLEASHHHEGHHGGEHHRGPHEGPRGDHHRGHHAPPHGHHDKPPHPMHRFGGHHGHHEKEEAPVEQQQVEEPKVDDVIVVNEYAQEKVGDDPKRDYFEKLGAQWASGFLAGTAVGEIDEIELFECLHAEPKAVELFYKADEAMKYALVKK